ncbi:MAG: HD domain-containing protein [Bacteroidetes bacterium]|nr:HD domain-containing protein [Bacteroidota bacterium]
MKNKPELDKLKFPYKRILVFPDRNLRATALEMAAIDTRIFQRLRFTRQLGNSYVAFPTADHSRFSHSLGVCYWAGKILSALKENHNTHENEPLLHRLNKAIADYLAAQCEVVPAYVFNNELFLGVSWFEQLVRMYGLLHDITHIPYGHTLEDQAGLFERHDDDFVRLGKVFDKLKEEVRGSQHFDECGDPKILESIMIEYIKLVELLFLVGYITDKSNTLSKIKNDQEQQKKWEIERKTLTDRWATIQSTLHEPLILTYDIVSNTICADLMDYTLRDTLFASMPKSFDKALLVYMKIVQYDTTIYGNQTNTNKMYRLGVSVSRKKIRHDIITAILDLLRIRYDLTEKVYYHHTKVITDAMLEKIIRSLPTATNTMGLSLDEVNEIAFTTDLIYSNYLGDEGFLRELEHRLSKFPSLQPLKLILNKIFTRRLYKSVFRTNFNATLNGKGRQAQNSCNNPNGRSQIESFIITTLRNKYDVEIEDGDLIVSYPPKKMQMKIAKALIEWTDGQIYPFDELPIETNYSNEVGVLTDRYKSLWALNIFLNPDKIHLVKLVESICEDTFHIRNEYILNQYLSTTYSDFYASTTVMRELSLGAMSRESEFIKSEAAKGSSYLNDEVLESVAVKALEMEVDKRKSKKPKKDNPNKNNNSNESLL